MAVVARGYSRRRLVPAHGILARIGCGADSTGPGSGLRRIAPWLAAGLLSINGCGGATESNSPFVDLSYRAKVTGAIVLDSAVVDNGTGNFFHAVDLVDGWSVHFDAPRPGTVEGTLYYHSTGPGTVKFRALWVEDGITLGDSVVANPTTAISGSLGLPMLRF